MSDGAAAAPSFWLEQLDLPSRPVVDGDMDVDVCIVGAGYTGLWTAYYLLAADPSLSVAVVERHHVGWGASGRNGGWVSGKVAGLERLLARRKTRADAVAMQKEMYRTIDEIADVLRAESIDCGWAKGGTLLAATGPAQVPRLQESVAMKHEAGFTEDDVRWLAPADAVELIRPAHLHGALYTPHCASVDPARLALGLADAVERRGGRIFEQSPATVSPRVVDTPTGKIRAETIVMATEAYSIEERGRRRSLIPVYSLMVMTEPLDETVWAEIGIARRETFSDGRVMIVYGQRTEDGRVAFGGRGAPYHYGSSIRASHDRDGATFDRLRETLVSMFPALRDVAFVGEWGGPLGIPRDWRPSITHDPLTGVVRAGGYVGQGVSTANLAGRTITDIVLERESDLLALPWVGHRSRRWEPEPLRWMGVNMGRRLTESIDAAEDRGRRPRLRHWVLDRLPVG